MKIYRVGGAVRDELLGLPVKDQDYVVVGAAAAELVAKGFKPVGAGFPVFLHPDTYEEYALARTERKTAPGYAGFAFHAAPEVTLEQDLARRDLTINAMARDATGKLIDPYHGERDLKAGILRHVSSAFAEDPVRILRVARFAARFGFKVADETFALMRHMVASGEVDALVAERVWQEIARGLMEAAPSRMFRVLRDCGALARILPEIDALFGLASGARHACPEPGDRALAAADRAALNGGPLAVRFAALTLGIAQCEFAQATAAEERASDTLGQERIRTLCERIRVPGDCRDVAIAAAKWFRALLRPMLLQGEGLLALFEGTDALRRPERFVLVIDACAAYHQAFDSTADNEFPQRVFLLDALAALRGGDIQDTIGNAAPDSIPAAIRARRIAVLDEFMTTRRGDR